MTVLEFNNNNWTAPADLLAAVVCDVQVGGHHEVGGQLQVGLLVPGLDQSEVSTAPLRQSQLTCMKSCLVTRRGRCGLPGSESRVRSTAEMESRSCGGEEYWGRAEAEDRAENTPGMVNLVSHRKNEPSITLHHKHIGSVGKKWRKQRFHFLHSPLRVAAGDGDLLPNTPLAALPPCNLYNAPICPTLLQIDVTVTNNVMVSSI